MWNLLCQNIKYYCAQKGVKPTNACKESGVGGSFINDIERGRTPSVSKVQMLANYLGVTTSELLGEERKKARRRGRRRGVRKRSYFPGAAS